MPIRPFLAVALTLLALHVPARAAGPLEDADVSDPWPREVELPEGTLRVYQPQVERLEGDRLSGRAAVSITFEGTSEPIFGAVWITARIETDTQERSACLVEAQVPRVRFSATTHEQETRLQELFSRAAPTWRLPISLDRLSASLATAHRPPVESARLSHRPPRIVFRRTTSVLVPVDGRALFERVEGTLLRRVVNTPFLLVNDSGTYYLYAGEDTWYAGRGGTYRLAETVPADVAGLAPDPQPELELPETAPDQEGVVPEIVVATEPTELVYTTGEPVLRPVVDGELSYVTNTDSDLFFDVKTRRYFVLLSGRWFAGPSLADGPWTFVAADALPEAFARIPEDSDVGGVRAFVAGTAEARDAVLDACLPQTATVDRARATSSVTYDGHPRFEDIPGTRLLYGVNTDADVIASEGRFFACSAGIWFVADEATGPWAVATERPEGLEEIPPESPVYAVRYVDVYDSTPDVVHVGYLPGYHGSYVSGATIVYGTGYAYPSWYRGAYDPRPATWGFHARRSPFTGWSFGVSIRSPRFTFGIGYEPWCSWSTGTWGPAGFHGYWRGHPRAFYRGWEQGAYDGFRAGYGAGLRAGYRNVNSYRDRPGARPGLSASVARSGARTGTRQEPNDCYADRWGDVHRYDGRGGWERVGGREPGRDGLPREVRDELEQDARARTRGSERTRSFRSSRAGGRAGVGERR